MSPQFRNSVTVTLVYGCGVRLDIEPILVRPQPIKGALHGAVRKVPPPNDHRNHDTANERERRTGAASAHASDRQL